MRFLVVLLSLAAFAASSSVNSNRHAADQSLLVKQQEVIQLLQKITQDIPNPQLQALGESYDIESNAQQYDNPMVVKYYAGAVKAGLVQPQGTAFSNSNSQLRKEVALLNRILTGAKDYPTFLRTAAWARVHVNEAQFVKAFIAAVLMRDDTQGIILPPSYEIWPQLHLDARIIQEAQVASAQGIQKGIQNIVIPVNYSALMSPEEQQLSYFTQDVGLASWYGYLNLAGYISEEGQQGSQQQQQQQQPLTSQQYQQQIVGKYLNQAGQNQQGSIGHGGKYLHLHQQLLALYELNRLSNGLSPIDEIDFTNVQTPYQPHLRNLNGLEFPGRPENLQLDEDDEELVEVVQTLEQRLKEAIDSGHVITPQGVFLSLYQPQGVNILGDLIEGSGKSVNPRYYGSLQAVARKLLGNAPDAQNIWDYTPSVLELGQTAVHDPAFYQLAQKIVNLWRKYQKSLPAYQVNDLILPGVTIQNVEISQLVTLFTDFVIDLDAVTAQPSQSQQQQQQQQQQLQQQVQAHLKRLDHKPYTYQITVQSEQSVPNAVVRVFLGPKHDYQGKPIGISQNRHLFVQLDQFIHNLQQGQNLINRNSQQAPGQSFDWPSVQTIQQGVNSAISSQEPFYITEPHQIFSLPARLALPKGQPQGFPLQLLVVITGPGQLNVPHGPVIPQESLTYQPQQYQIVNAEQYEQLKQQQNQLAQLSGIQQNVEVLPENWEWSQQQIEGVRNHYANVYTKYHGQYPHTQIQNPVGQGQDMTYTIQGIGSQLQQQLNLQAQIQAQTQQGQIPTIQTVGGQQGGQVGSPLQQIYGQKWTPAQSLKWQQQVSQGQQGIQGLQGLQGVQQGVQGLQGIQGVQGVQGVQGLQQGVLGGIQGGQGGQGGQGVQGVQGVQHGVQGLQGVQQGVQGLSGSQQGVQGLQGAGSGVQGIYGAQGVGQNMGGLQGQQNVEIPYGMQGAHSVWQGIQGSKIQNQMNQMSQISDGQQHAGGFQGIYAQPQTVQDQAVNDYYQNKPISEIIGGAISLDGKPLGFPLDRPLTPGALGVANIYVKDVLIYHEGQPTNDITQ